MTSKILGSYVWAFTVCHHRHKYYISILLAPAVLLAAAANICADMKLT